MFNLVRAATQDDLLLSGLYVPGPKNRPALLHIHGSEGDFFSNEFIAAFAQKLNGQNAFLTVQTRGTAGDLGIFKADRSGWVRAGGWYELLSEAKLDIDAWVKFLIGQGYSKVILSGHSLGTLKVTRYLFEGAFKDKIAGLILLAPFDNIYLAEHYTKGRWPKYLVIAKQKVAAGQGKKIIPKRFLDSKVSYQTYLSWLGDGDFSHTFDFHRPDYDFPILNKIKVPVLVVAGTKDEYFHPSNPNRPEEVIGILNRHIAKCETFLINGSGHNYVGFQTQVADAVTKFLVEPRLT